MKQTILTKLQEKYTHPCLESNRLDFDGICGAEVVFSDLESELTLFEQEIREKTQAEIADRLEIISATCKTTDQFESEIFALFKELRTLQKGEK